MYNGRWIDEWFCKGVFSPGSIVINFLTFHYMYEYMYEYVYERMYEYMYVWAYVRVSICFYEYMYI